MIFEGLIKSISLVHLLLSIIRTQLTVIR